MATKARTSNAKASGAGRERLLDTAEMLFASSGYEGATIREMARLADVEVGLTNYHFGSKEALYREVLLRRAPALADDLDQSLAAALVAGSIEAILAAFVKPHLMRVCDEDAGWRNYMRLIAYVSLMRRSPALTISAGTHFLPVLARYQRAMADHAAHLPPEKVAQVFEAFHMAILSICIGVGQNSAGIHHYSIDQFRSLVATCVEVFSRGVSEP